MRTPPATSSLHGSCWSTTRLCRIRLPSIASRRLRALKAFLVWRAVPFQRVHNLTYLMDLCEQEEPGLASLRDRTDTLTPYAVEVRYPGVVIVSPDEAGDALQTAEDVFAAVLALVPAECHPT